MNEDPEYASYNGLNRPALIRGIPLMPALACAFFMVIFGFAALYAWGIVGLVVPLFFAIPLLIMKVLCADDPNALSLFRWSFQGSILRIKQKKSVLVFVTGSNHAGKKNAYQIFKKQQG